MFRNVQHIQYIWKQLCVYIEYTCIYILYIIYNLYIVFVVYIGYTIFIVTTQPMWAHSSFGCRLFRFRGLDSRLEGCNAYDMVCCSTSLPTWDLPVLVGLQGLRVPDTGENKLPRVPKREQVVHTHMASRVDGVASVCPMPSRSPQKTKNIGFRV